MVAIDTRYSAKVIFDAINADHECEETRKTRLLERVEEFFPLDYSDWVGSIDATSCIGATFWDKKGTVITVHIDGRGSENLFPLFERYTPEDRLVLELTGGVLEVSDRQRPEYRYDSLTEETQRNFSCIIELVEKLKCHVDIRGWSVGFSSDKDDLVCDYLAHPDGRLVAVKPETIYNSCDIPLFFSRMAYVGIDQNEGYHTIVLDEQSESIPLRERPDQFQERFGAFAKTVTSYGDDDQSLLNRFSTTPQLESEHFATTVREIAELVFNPPEDAALLESCPRPKESPLIVLQGEAVSFSSESLVI
ncbi:MAG: hypothetical protein H7A37_09345 [Chlamydiales bacterium]|nr:hypothetical protein [Chlamydiia bacterium]MCP5508481.1 hypothetical protein [Chlamydiales bacterium]